MPATETRVRHVETCPSLGHVNLMIDTFIANASSDDLRSIIRNLLATGPPGIALAFSNAARSRLRQTSLRPMLNHYSLFRKQTRDASAAPLPQLYDALSRARSLYGVGLGIASLPVLSSIVQATIGLRWKEEGDMTKILAVIDADIGQAIQSSKEEIEENRVFDFASAHAARNELHSVVNESAVDVKSWGGEFPFERASSSIEYWKF